MKLMHLLYTKTTEEIIMWTRSEVKKKGQQTFNRNYWKCVLVALIMALVTGSSGGFSAPTSGSSSALVGSSNDDATVHITTDGDEAILKRGLIQRQ